MCTEHKALDCSASGLFLRFKHSKIQAFPSPDKLPAVPNEPEFLKKVVKRFQSGSTKPQILGKVEESCQLQSEDLSAIQRAVAEGDYFLISNVHAASLVFG